MITVTGGTRTQRNYAQSIAEFCVEKLMPRITGLDIQITIKKFKEDSLGYAWPSDETEAYDRPRCFDIEVHSKQSLRRFLETVAHEMVHVKQFAKGELYEGIRVNKHRWLGEYVDNDIDYWDLPWEIEAHGRECGLFIRWAEKEGLASKSWTQDPI